MTFEDFKEAYKDKTPTEKLSLMCVQHDYWRNDVKDRVDANWRGNYEEARYYASECDAMADRVAWLHEEIKKALEKLEPVNTSETRMMSAAEVVTCPEGTVVWVEERQRVTWNLFPLEIYTVSTHPGTGTAYLFFVIYDSIKKFECSEYNRTWRCWTERPTDEQREAEPWEK